MNLPHAWDGSRGVLRETSLPRVRNYDLCSLAKVAFVGLLWLHNLGSLSNDALDASSWTPETRHAFSFGFAWLLFGPIGPPGALSPRFFFRVGDSVPLLK